jgi:hypothetical protein
MPKPLPISDLGRDPEPDGAPRPEAIRFYGTRWVDHSGGYALRRVGLGIAALLLAAAGGLLEFLVFVSVGAAWLRGLAALALALSSAMAFVRTWSGYARPAGAAGDEARVDESAFRSIKVVGFVGVLVAYALRTATEAPGERLRRMDYEAALERHRRTIAKRTRNPARRRPGKRGGKRRP